MRSADFATIATLVIALAGSGIAHAVDEPRLEPVPAESLPTIPPLKLARSTRVDIQALGHDAYRLDEADVSCDALTDRLRDRAISRIVVAGTLSNADVACIGAIAKALGATAYARDADGTLRTLQRVD